MITERIFDLDGEKREFLASAISCNRESDGRYAVVLDRTAFFCGGGGQECDTGTIGFANVLEVCEKNGEIIHYTDAPVEKEIVLKGRLDWEKRFRRMQNHTGEHIISGLIHEKYGFENVGFHMGHDDVTADFDGVLTEEQLREIEILANRIVYENRTVSAEYPSEERLAALKYRCKSELKGRVRIVTIEGCDRCACCAPHVALTGEIGIIHLLGFIHYKGGIRIHMLCGLDAIDRIKKDCADMKRISSSLSAKINELPDAVSRLQQNESKLKKEISELKKAVADSKIELLRQSGEDVFLVENSLDFADLQRVVFETAEATGKLCMAITGSDDEGYKYVISSKSRNMKDVSRTINETLGGKGGGNLRMAQGAVKAKETEIRRLFNYLKNQDS